MYSDAQRQIQDAARRFASTELAPGAAARDRSECFPRQAIEALGRLGLMGMLVSEEHGGAGIGTVAYALAIAEIAEADGACSTIVSVHNASARSTRGRPTSSGW